METFAPVHDFQLDNVSTIDTLWAMAWNVIYSQRAAKLREKIPERVKAILDALIIDIRATGPVRGDWPNYSKLSGELHHCHLKKGNQLTLPSGEVRPTKFILWRSFMLGHTKKRLTESIRILGSPEIISRLRKYALKVGASIIENDDKIPASDISPELDTNPAGVYLRGIRLRDDLTQEALAELTGISRSNISAMEHGKRPIGKETAQKLAVALNCDYRRFL